MAIDEAILRCSTEESTIPTLRLYGWQRPAVSLGYFQETADSINDGYCRSRGIDVVRRPTGGRAVLHGSDLTYAVVARTDNSDVPGGIMETYRIFSECIRRGLKRAGIDASMAEKAANNAPVRHGCCFSVPARHELLAGGRKICGSAQMRVRGAYLQHGSIPLSLDVRELCMIMNPAEACAAVHGYDTPGLDAAAEKLRKRITSVSEEVPAGVTVKELCRSLTEGFEEVLGVRLAPAGLTDRERQTAENLLAEKYRTERWNREGKMTHEDSNDL